MTPPPPVSSTPEELHDAHHWRHLQLRLLFAYNSEKWRDLCRTRVTVFPPTGLWHVISGRCRLEQAGKVLHASAGDWVFPASAVRGFVFEPGTRLLSIGFVARWPHGIDLVSNDEPKLLRPAPELEIRLRRLADAVEAIVGSPCDWERAVRWHENLAVGDYFAVEGLFRHWLQTFVSLAPGFGCRVHPLATSEPRVDLAIRLIEQHAGRASQFWPEIVQQTGLSRRRMDSLFRRATGRSLAEFAERLLLNRASAQLRDVRLQIKSIAVEAGFENPSTFSRWFRHHTGMTPSEFRRSSGSDSEAGV